MRQGDILAFQDFEGPGDSTVAQPLKVTDFFGNVAKTSMLDHGDSLHVDHSAWFGVSASGQVVRNGGPAGVGTWPETKPSSMRTPCLFLLDFVGVAPVPRSVTKWVVQPHPKERRVIAKWVFRDEVFAGNIIPAVGS
jgi:hypothetical protein